MIKETIHTNAEEQATELATVIAQQLNDIANSSSNTNSLSNNKSNAVLAVSGGRSPIPFLQALSKQDIAWDKVTVTLVDERIVETTHEDSNSKLVRDYLLQNKAKQATFHNLVADDLSIDDLEKDPATLADQLAEQADQDFIQPDIIVLGMGTDGHTASLFPQVADLSDSSNILTCKPTTAPYHRLSLTLNKILKAKHLYLAIGGEEKQKVYDKAKANKTTDYPISYVLHQDVTLVNVYTF